MQLPSEKVISQSIKFLYPLEVDTVERENFEEEILSDSKPNVCSFKPEPLCNETPSEDRFAQIQLYDGSLHFVKELNIVITEASEDLYDCVGNGPQTGTPAFCKHHECVESGTMFCFYKKNDIAYFVSDEGKIAVKAWGYVNGQYYNEKSVPLDAATCQTCEIKCIQGGVEIITEEKIRMIQICSDPVCYSISQPNKRETIMLPSELTLQDHDVSVKVWSNG
ncbi:MAG: hypothetical protein GY696_09940, partial [Gammaproteobacteria bacterium]|nr:hypothetical protein [Gammaproteobacteria bacterium]